MWLIACAFLLIIAGTGAFQFWAHMRILAAFMDADVPAVDIDRYRPMLRLLSDEDSELTADPGLRRKLRAKRCNLFHGYLRLLAEDYGKSLAGLRLIVAQSRVDRPDLAKALLRNRVLFAVGLCRAEFRLRLYACGISSPDALKHDLLGLVDALNALRGQCSFLAESAVWGG